MCSLAVLATHAYHPSDSRNVSSTVTLSCSLSLSRSLISLQVPLNTSNNQNSLGASVSSCFWLWRSLLRLRRKKREANLQEALTILYLGVEVFVSRLNPTALCDPTFARMIPCSLHHHNLVRANNPLYPKASFHRETFSAHKFVGRLFCQLLASAGHFAARVQAFLLKISESILNT